MEGLDLSYPIENRKHQVRFTNLNPHKTPSEMTMLTMPILFQVKYTYLFMIITTCRDWMNYCTNRQPPTPKILLFLYELKNVLYRSVVFL